MTSPLSGSDPKSTRVNNLNDRNPSGWHNGWWFGIFPIFSIFFYILGIIIPTDFHIIFIWDLWRCPWENLPSIGWRAFPGNPLLFSPWNIGGSCKFSLKLKFIHWISGKPGFSTTHRRQHGENFWSVSGIELKLIIYPLSFTYNYIWSIYIYTCSIQYICSMYVVYIYVVYIWSIYV